MKTSSVEEITDKCDESSESVATSLESDKLLDNKDKRSTMKTKLKLVKRNKSITENRIIFVSLSKKTTKNWFSKL